MTSILRLAVIALLLLAGVGEVAPALTGAMSGGVAAVALADPANEDQKEARDDGAQPAAETEVTDSGGEMDEALCDAAMNRVHSVKIISPPSQALLQPQSAVSQATPPPQL